MRMKFDICICIFANYMWFVALLGVIYIHTLAYLMIYLFI